MVGEVVRYKVYLLQDARTTESKVVRVDWYSPDGKLMEKQLLAMKDGLASGSFRIPLRGAEGYYSFNAYTVKNLNYDNDFVFRKSIPVYNNLAETRGETILVSDKTIEHKIPYAKGAIAATLQTDKATYARREPVALSIELKDKSGNPVAGNLSVRVLDAKAMPLDLFPEKSIAAVAESYGLVPSSPEVNHRAAEQSMVISGQVINPDNGAIVHEKYLSLYIVEDKTFRRFSTKETDTFRLAIPAFYGNRTIQVLSMNPNYPQALRWVPTDPSIKPAINRAGLPRSADLARYLQQEQMRRKISDIFRLDQDSLESSKSSALAGLTPDNTYLMSNYQNLESVGEFFREIAIKSELLENAKGKRLRIFDGDNNEMNHLPVFFMVDGVFISDADRVLQLPFNKIERIDLFSKRGTIKNQLDSLMFHGGVIAIYTKVGRQQPIAEGLEEGMYVHGLTPETPFVVPHQNPRVPDFRPLLYWNSNIMVGRDGKAQVQFPTSDAVTEFTVRVEGVSASGEPVIGEIPLIVNK